MILLMHILGIVNMYYVVAGGSLINIVAVVFCAYAIRVVKLVNKAKK
jgi:uncharacterized membrane protein